MVNYAMGKIYKIVDNTNGNIYIGSTCEPTLARKLSSHVCHYKRYLNRNGPFVTSFKIFENEDYDIVLVVYGLSVVTYIIAISVAFASGHKIIKTVLSLATAEPS